MDIEEGGVDTTAGASGGALVKQEQDAEGDTDSDWFRLAFFGKQMIRFDDLNYPQRRKHLPPMRVEPQSESYVGMLISRLVDL